jgi:RNA polymerase sigma-70 factor (ECF subfamily)
MWDVGEIAGPPPEDTDRQLVEQTLAGNKEAFARLHKRYYARVYRYALFRTRGPQDAEDIAGETFVRAISHLHTYRFVGESIFPWLSRIAANLIADQGRKGAGVSVLSLDAGGTGGDEVRAFLEGLPGNAPDPHRVAESHETQGLLRATIARLPADQAEAVLLRFVADLSLKEIALSMNKTEGAIKSLLHRALVNLRKMLAETEEARHYQNSTHQRYNKVNQQEGAPATQTAHEGRGPPSSFIELDGND